MIKEVVTYPYGSKKTVKYTYSGKKLKKQVLTSGTYKQTYVYKYSGKNLSEAIETIQMGKTSTSTIVHTYYTSGKYKGLESKYVHTLSNNKVITTTNSYVLDKHGNVKIQYAHQDFCYSPWSDWKYEYTYKKK